VDGVGDGGDVVGSCAVNADGVGACFGPGVADIVVDAFTAGVASCLYWQIDRASMLLSMQMSVLIPVPPLMLVLLSVLALAGEMTLPQAKLLRPTASKTIIVADL